MSPALDRLRDRVDAERADPTVPRPPMPDVLPEPSERGEAFVRWLRALGS